MSNGVQNTSLEPLPAPKARYKPRKTLKPPAIQSAVLAKRAAGHSKAKITRDLGIATNTVTSIIELNDFDRTLQSEQASSISLIPRAIQVAHERLSKGSENMAIKVLENTIWPLNAKPGKSSDPHLTLAIQNLMGNVSVGTAPDPKTIEVKPSEPEPVRDSGSGTTVQSE